MKSHAWKLLVILPALTLFVAGCKTPSSPMPSVTQTALGNAYRLQLPAGTVLTFPSDAAASQVRAVAVNETAATGTRALTLTQPLQLVSPAYIAGRNDTERAYAQRIAELEEQLRATTPLAK